MKSEIVYVPIRCPRCQQTVQVPYTRLEVAARLNSADPFVIFSPCHDVSWTATEQDRRIFALIKPSSWLADSELGATRPA